MVEKEIENFSLAQICRSGQCFRMEETEDDLFTIYAGDRCIKIWQNGKSCRFYCGEEEYDEFWKDYFDLDNDYSVYMAQANPNDAYLNRAIAFGSGMRILKQDLWEMIVSFLISQQNNIVRIRRCIANICEKYGEEKVIWVPQPPEKSRQLISSQEENRKIRYHAFPAPEALCGLPEDALKECNLGYRSKYVVRAARSVVSGEFDPEAVSAMSYRKAKEELLKLFGVGEKVADCICLFALHHLQAFPMDTHIKQAMAEHYKRGFPNRRYRGFQGVMQQYIFYYELCGKKEYICEGTKLKEK
ncbi:DNA glycosylase [Eubacterium sp. An3]|uniref:DNA glycosylase n=1 Tax=Eubacterium sp. An3 TaxID=1965628 RepID=UPI000B3A728F|nr:DNA glycosylase [Eubacterium sp. An3]OUO26772.1 8-oxoguanine DNA glycosylase [Eubacterium sp. An3]